MILIGFKKTFKTSCKNLQLVSTLLMQDNNKHHPIISIVVPVYNEADTIVECLTALERYKGCSAEVIVVDGGSVDNTRQKVADLNCTLITSQKGRAVQMNTGAEQAKGDLLVFLHADTIPPASFASDLEGLLIEADLVEDAGSQGGAQRATTSGRSSQNAAWGFFNIRLSGAGWQFRIIEWFMNRRSSWTSIGTGDQILYVRRSIFGAIGGFSEIPLMEDVELSKRLRARYGRANVLPSVAITSSRRWQEQGILRTVLLMWSLRWAYWRGEDPGKLAARYRNDKA